LNAVFLPNSIFTLVPKRHDALLFVVMRIVAYCVSLGNMDAGVITVMVSVSCVEDATSGVVVGNARVMGAAEESEGAMTHISAMTQRIFRISIYCILFFRAL